MKINFKFLLNSLNIYQIITECINYDDLNECLNHSCIWIPNYCYGDTFDCFIQASQIDCKHKHCQWFEEKCLNQGDINPNNEIKFLNRFVQDYIESDGHSICSCLSKQEQCIYYPQCSWISASYQNVSIVKDMNFNVCIDNRPTKLKEGCKAQCSGVQTQRLCNQLNFCKWQGTVCYDRNIQCSKIRVKNDCLAFNCSWNEEKCFDSNFISSPVKNKSIIFKSIKKENNLNDSLCLDIDQQNKCIELNCSQNCIPNEKTSEFDINQEGIHKEFNNSIKQTEENQKNEPEIFKTIQKIMTQKDNRSSEELQKIEDIQCMKYNSKNNCISQGCFWDSEQCYGDNQDCQINLNIKNCQNAGCIWQTSSCTRQDNCYYQQDKNTCQRIDYCVWIENPFCYGTTHTCFSIFDIQSCLNVGCFWSYQFCDYKQSFQLGSSI